MHLKSLAAALALKRVPMRKLYWISAVASRRDQQQEGARLLVLRLLSDNPKISTRGLADAVGISNGSAYYVIKSLIGKGFVKIQSFRNSEQKRQYAYLLTPKGFREKSLLTRRFIKLKRKEFEDLKIEIQSLEKEAGLALEVMPAFQEDKTP